MMDSWRMWEEEWQNAKRFFDSKGDVKTRAKLKERWHKAFIKMLNEAYKAAEWK